MRLVGGIRLLSIIPKMPVNILQALICYSIKNVCLFVIR